MLNLFDHITTALIGVHIYGVIQSDYLLLKNSVNYLVNKCNLLVIYYD
jgi:hypothetical protein